jgi:hypothetical protein
MSPELAAQGGESIGAGRGGARKQSALVAFDGGVWGRRLFSEQLVSATDHWESDIMIADGVR